MAPLDEFEHKRFDTVLHHTEAGVAAVARALQRAEHEVEQGEAYGVIPPDLAQRFNPRDPLAREMVRQAVWYLTRGHELGLSGRADPWTRAAYPRVLDRLRADIQPLADAIRTKELSELRYRTIFHFPAFMNARAFARAAARYGQVTSTDPLDGSGKDGAKGRVQLITRVYYKSAPALVVLLKKHRGTSIGGF